MGPKTKPLIFKIDPSYLNAAHINPDEDDMLPNGQRSDRDYPEYKSLGELAERMDYGNPPALTEREISKGKNVAYRGIIPPEALTPGYYNDGTWRPIESPHTAALIGDMRDGWGRFAVAAAWEPGQWGKGIYYPETGVLQTWADDRTHLDVWGDDENYSQPGSAHHIVIRPNGSVHDQGAFDRDFGDAQSDVEGLQRALRELDPNLRLDAPSDWSFMSPTEPMESEPSAISRGEQGDADHGVQTSNDYAGGL
jgi:hypothetical protein